MLVAIDLAAEPVLLAIDLRLLGFGEMAIMILAVIADFVVEPGLFPFETRRLAGRQLTGFHALRDTVLLVVRNTADIQILWKPFIAVFLLLTV